ncbi:right-handed parallel beta-helix repeat-containing protein [Candidatus Gracilibacteria bacterium]|nr:right-handed parallel beta-helix repeat-containing protein [Candidatus Gracilibacteria bacterium]
MGFSFAPVYAETIADLDIFADTVWTEAMSPIVIKANSRNDYIRRVANGAQLTIEAGVEVRFEPGMSLQISSQCLRGYGSEACYRDREGNLKVPKLIARGTSIKPIIFTSNQKIPQPGDWGSVILDARDNEVEWVEFRYGGMRSKRAFVEVNNSFFENNLIESGGEAIALFASSQKIAGNVIQKNGGVGIFCEHQCEIDNNFIVENPGSAIELSTLLETKITNNFIYKNGGNGISNENILTVAVTAEGNYFLENSGGIYSHRSHELGRFNRNNFLKNKNFAIKSDINNRGEKIYPAEGNWFGIDTGSKKSVGEYFVSSDYDTSKFLPEGNDFKITGNSKAARSYRDYLSANNLEEAFFEAQVKRLATIGSASLAGSLLRYSVTLSNRTTKAVDGTELLVSMPGDQLLLLCSALPVTASFDYSLQNACTMTLSSDVTFSNNRLVWRPGVIPAINEKTLFFTMMLKPTAQSTASLPRLDFGGKPFSYTLDSLVKLKEGGGSESAQTAQVANPVATSPAPVVVAPKVEIPVVAVPVDGALATGTVSRQILNGILNYVLTTADGKNYSLFNKWKWREIDDFTKSVDKNKTIAVYGDFYFNRFGIATGVKFTRFEIR